jgi:prevent-host-death family protein
MGGVAMKVDLGRVEVVTMRELTLHTAAVIDRLRAEGLPRVVVKHGRFQAALWPLRSGIEADALSSAVDASDFVLQGSAKGVPVQDLIQDADKPAPGRVDLSVDAPEADEPRPMSQEENDEVDVIEGRQHSYGIATMSELSQNPSTVVSRVREGERLVVTRHGRFLALLVPLPPNLESRLLASVPDFMGTLDDGNREFSSGLPVDVAKAWTS